jgi:predicted AlkP superfamily phosphohydrolase/phosphomutase
MIRVKLLCGMLRKSVALLPLLLVACWIGKGGGSRVLLVGIDGATLRVALPLLEEGRLPNLERIGRRGVFGPLRSHFPLSSPRVWNSIATGKVPEKHGILGFARPREGSPGQRLYLSLDRKVHALWNIASDAGLTVGVVNWWNTYPVEKIRGVMVSDHVLPGEISGRSTITRAVSPERGPIIHPEEWAERVAAAFEDGRPLTGIADPFQDRTAFPSWVNPDRLSERYGEDQSRIALEIQHRLRPDLLMVLLPGVDRISHVLWGALEPPEIYRDPPAMTAEEREASAAALRRYYEYTDALIGRLMEAYRPEDLVVVVSDHGFEAGRSLAGVTGVHSTRKALRGVIFASGRGIRPPWEKQPVSVNDVTPTLLAWLGLPVGADMDGRVASFLADREVERIASHDAAPIERLSHVPSGAETEILEQLQALGYFEHDASE